MFINCWLGCLLYKNNKNNNPANTLLVSQWRSICVIVLVGAKFCILRREEGDECLVQGISPPYTTQVLHCGGALDYSFIWTMHICSVT